MTPHCSLLWYIHLSLSILLFLTRETISQTCLVVYITVNDIDPNLNATDYEGLYEYKGQQGVNDCPRYSTFDGKTLSAATTFWTITSNTNPPTTLSYEPVTFPEVCDPPIEDPYLLWQSSASSMPTNITMTCSDTTSPTQEPTEDPTKIPSSNPTMIPSYDPTMIPSEDPTSEPTTAAPSSNPTMVPTMDPTDGPTMDPTKDPTMEPTMATEGPSAQPSMSPTEVPTRSPTEEVCSRIELGVLGIAVTNHYAPDPIPIVGIYYQQNGLKNGYPFYRQQGDKKYGEISWDDGYWKIVDVSSPIELQTQDAWGASTPPHEQLEGYTWTDLLGDVGVSTWTVTITCTQITSDPTTNPSDMPSVNPTTDPTLEPTAGPTLVPTLEPTPDPTEDIITTGMAEEATEEDSPLDVFTILEWIIIAAMLVVCCLVICALCLWRNKKLEKAKQTESAHKLSAMGDDEELELAQKKKSSNVHTVDFTGARETAASTEADGRTQKNGATPIARPNYQDAAVANDFSNALAVVSQHKSKKSLNTDEAVAVTIIKSDSEFYGDHPIDQIYSYTFITKPFGMEWKTTKTDKKNLYVSKIQNGSQAASGNVKMGSKLLAFNGEMIEDLGAKDIYGKLAVADMPLTITFLKPAQERSDEAMEGDQSSRQKAKQQPMQPVMSDSAADDVSDLVPPPVPKPALNKRDTTPPAPNEAQPVQPPQDAPPERDLHNQASYALDGDLSDEDGGQSPLIPPKVPSVLPVADDGDDPFQEIGPPPVPANAVPDSPVDDVGHDRPLSGAEVIIPQVFGDEEPETAIENNESFHAD